MNATYSTQTFPSLEIFELNDCHFLLQVDVLEEQIDTLEKAHFHCAVLLGLLLLVSFILTVVIQVIQYFQLQWDPRDPKGTWGVRALTEAQANKLIMEEEKLQQKAERKRVPEKSS